MKFSEAHSYLIKMGYKFSGSHMLFFRPRQEERDAVRKDKPTAMLERIDEAFAAVDTYHDLKDKQ